MNRKKTSIIVAVLLLLLLLIFLGYKMLAPDRGADQGQGRETASIPLDNTPESEGEPLDIPQGQESVPETVQTLPASIERCNQPWTTPLVTVTGTIREVVYISPGFSSQRGLHIALETADNEHIFVHVFPEPLIRLCTRGDIYAVGETVTVSGSEFAGKAGNICAAEITRGTEPLQFRDPMTGEHNMAGFMATCPKDDEPYEDPFEECRKQCLQECEGEPPFCMPNCMPPCVRDIMMNPAAQQPTRKGP